ncbi:LysR family transcriptional regulator [Zestomonas carbonaria]|uniref:HTH-type transcriptional regulator PgrR n=1 Tax=Zestomonas carbonaria TaxID=2762745 RepID=A0A7U7I769_9GAMM|nr:LysR family transcriptional regulator [Pseudomonas carbonaria]CAD5105895.1 HTH-type transcriptional regulator PgrR [Pseudomonas carbonaria]
MRQDHLDGLVTFVYVAEHCSFTAASHQLGVSPSAVSQVIRSLEERTGVVLFNRTTRSVRLTEAGERFLERIKPLVLELSSAAEDLADSSNTPSGMLRLASTMPAYLTVLRPVLGGFFERYPAIDIEVSLDESRVDIVQEGFDAGIRLGWQVERDMVAVSVGPELAMQVVVSPEYLTRRGAPRHPRDLLEHDCIGYRQADNGVVERWLLDNGTESFHLAVKGRLICNDSAAVVSAALDGLGIAYLASGHIDHLVRSGRLVQVLEDWGRPAARYMVYFPDRRGISCKLRLFIDYLRGAVPDAQEIDWDIEPLQP